MPASVTATLAPMVGAGRAETTLDNLLDAVRSYTPADDTPAAERLIRNATALAERAHEGQRRLTGEPFVQHPMSVALMLANLHLDPDTIAAALASIPGVLAEPFVPEIANHVPHLSLEWDYDRIPITTAEASGQLKQGHPPIEVGGHHWMRPNRQTPDTMQGLTVSVWMLRPGEDRIVAERLKSLLAG